MLKPRSIAKRRWTVLLGLVAVTALLANIAHALEIRNFSVRRFTPDRPSYVATMSMSEFVPPVRAEWDWGDGQTQTSTWDGNGFEYGMTHVYRVTEQVSLTVRVRVTDARGRTASESRSVLVTP